MSNLKELTKSHHSDAERQEFVSELMSGKITTTRYLEYLYNQYVIYRELEREIVKHNLFPDGSGIFRAIKILLDITEITDSVTTPKVHNSTKEYIRHLSNIKDDKEKIIAHTYVRHMGDLYGGQMISTKVPGSGMYYRFDTPDVYKQQIRDIITDDMADEANKCFEFATELFKEMSSSK